MQTWRRIAKQFRALEHDLVVLDGLGGLTIDRLYAEISRHKPHFTVVDYVQLMRRSRASMQSLGGLVEITNECKSIALATESVIMLVSQDNREAAQGGSTLSSMGGSISIGQAADIYVGMHQDEEMRAQNRMTVKLLKSATACATRPQTSLGSSAHALRSGRRRRRGVHEGGSAQWRVETSYVDVERSPFLDGAEARGEKRLSLR